MSDLGVARGRVVIDVSDVKRAQSEVQAASRGMTQALNAIGIGVGAREFVQFAVAADAIATSYRRQSVAAANLAGSQEQLNEMMRVYEQATGGALSKADALANVTKLMSVGFADSTQELEQFARVIRGISTAMGMAQDTVTQNLILELFTQRGARLDQLGLQYDKVKQRADELAASDSSLTQQMAYQQAVLEQAEKRFGGLADSAAGAKTGMEELRKEWADLMLAFGTTGPIDFVAQAMAEWLKQAKRDIDTVKKAIDDLNAAWNRMRYAAGIRHNIGAGTFNSPNLESGGGFPGSSPAESGPGIDMAARNEAIVEWSKGVRAIERQANRDRLDATRQYEEQRTSTLREYGKTIAREAEDFARARLRAEEDYAKSIADVRQAASQREIRMAEDLARTIAEARADSAERQAERQIALDERLADVRMQAAERRADLEADFTKQRERALRDHAERLRDAAANLDAVAVREAQRDYRNSRRDAQEDFDERLAKERKNEEKRLAELGKAHSKQTADEGKALQKRIDQANEAYRRQLKDARDADEQRLKDMAADFELRKAREDEDRAVRLERMAEDHADQMAEMARQQALRLQQISEQEQEERDLLDEEFRKELDALGIRTEQWTAAQKQITDYAIAEFDRWWSHITAIASGLAGIGPTNMIQPWAGPVFGGNNLSSGGSIGGTSVTVAPGAIQVYAATGQSPTDIAGAVRRELAIFFEELAN